MRWCPYPRQPVLRINIDTYRLFLGIQQRLQPQPGNPGIAQLPQRWLHRHLIDYNDCAGVLPMFRLSGSMKWQHTLPAVSSTSAAPTRISTPVEIWRFFNRFTLSGTPSAAGEAGTIPVFARIRIPFRNASVRSTGCLAEVTVYNTFGQLVHRSKPWRRHIRP